MYQLYKDHPEYFVLNEPGAHTDSVNGSKKLIETVSAAYVRGDLKLFENRLWLVSGVRFERTDDEGRGPLNDVRAVYQKDGAGNLLRDAAGRLIPITTDPLARAKLQYTERGAYSKKNYQGFYPSINSSWSFTPDIVARAAYAKTIGRPDIGFIIPGASVPDPDSATQNRVISATNTGLKPWSADNYDLTLEAYEVKGAVISVGGFRKDITNFFTALRTPATRELLESFGLSDEYLDYDIQTETNSTEDATISGFEWSWRQSLRPFALVPKWAKGLQLFVNGTHIKKGGPGADNFYFVAPRLINWGVSYVNPKLLLKMNVSQRKEGARAAVAPSATVPAGTLDWYESRITIDTSFEYRFHKRFALYGSARNLTRGAREYTRVAPGAPHYTHPSAYVYYGAMLTFGIKGTY